MSYTIFTSNPTSLIAQPGRAVNTFPSGLVRVDQTYLGRTAQAATHRATLAIGNNMPDGDSSPCIDGLKIFPEVQERRREDGFTEYLVSAYGRINSTGNKTFSKTLSEIEVQYTVVDTRPPHSSIPDPTKKLLQTINDRVIWKFVSNKAVLPSLLYVSPLKIYLMNGSSTAPFYLSLILDSSNYNQGENDPVTSKNLNVKTQVVSSENINFGDWDEWTVVYTSSQDGVLDFGIFYLLEKPIAQTKNISFDLAKVNRIYLNSNDFEINSGNSLQIIWDKIEYTYPGQNILIPKNTTFTTTLSSGSFVWVENQQQFNYDLSFNVENISRPQNFPTNENETFTSGVFKWLSTQETIVFLSKSTELFENQAEIGKYYAVYNEDARADGVVLKYTGLETDNNFGGIPGYKQVSTFEKNTQNFWVWKFIGFNNGVFLERFVVTLKNEKNMTSFFPLFINFIDSDWS